jgi:PAS domain S-box-containing protein
VDLSAVQVLSNYRQTVFQEMADAVLSASSSDPDFQATVFPRLSALLAASLEEIRVAEEELAEQNAALLEQRQDHQRRLDYQRRLFELAPCALLVTNSLGVIVDVNRAAETLLGQSAARLDRKPLVSLVPLEDRRAFRSELGRMTLAQSASDWRFRLSRARDVPVTVSATVHVIPAGHMTADAALYWSIQPLRAD